MKQGRLIFGGSFNPLHIGHMRLALETLETLAGLIKSVEFLPSAVPPHKLAEPILPFSLRAAMIRATIKDQPYLACNEIEADLAAPSFTWNTLSELAAEAPLFFLLGSQDYELLSEWYNGLELPKICNLVIAPRGVYSRDDFMRQTKKFWPDCGPVLTGPADACTGEKCWRIALAQGSSVYLLPAPHLAISSTRIRRLWLCGKNIDYLVPWPALALLEKERGAVRACWQENKCSM